MQCKSGKIIFLEEPVKDVGGQHHCRRDRDLYVPELPRQPVPAQQVAHESQATCLAAQRSNPDAKEVSVGGSQGRRAEIGDQHLALLATIIGDGIHQVLPEVLGAGEVRNLARTQFLRQGKFGARHQPV